MREKLLTENNQINICIYEKLPFPLPQYPFSVTFSCISEESILYV